jgi:dihydroorotate dehydrogenase (NAD+) catalytic subunit
MIELAPRNKQGLVLRSPVIAGSGAVGFADAWPPGISPQMFDAIVTPPISLAPRSGTGQPRLAELPDGFLLATGDQNPGYRRVIAQHAAAWRRLGVPVIVALAVAAGNDWPELAARMEEDGAAAGVELALPHGIPAHQAAADVAAVRRAATLPILVRLPSPQAWQLARACVDAGADALVVGTPPLGAYPARDHAGAEASFIEAPVSGPAAFPFTLSALREVLAQGTRVPIIAAGGIHTVEHARLCLQLGAAAVQIRSLLWTNPTGAAELCALLAEKSTG